ncbi:MAG: rhomboid family intramembrane serine protease [Acidimicrobiia bacterium]
MVIPLHDDNPARRFPVVTVALIAINVVVFFFVQPRSGSEEVEFTYEYAAIPCEVTQGEPLSFGEIQSGECNEAEVIGDPEPFPGKNVYLSVLYSMFLHGSILHLAGNMLFLWVFGNNVEDHMTPVGFLLFYLVVGSLAMVAHVAPDPGSTTPVIGASGAIAGVMGAYLVLWPRARILTFVPLLLFFVAYLPAGLVLALWFGLQFLTNPNSGVAWVAHVGGFAAGVLIALALRALFGPPRHHVLRGPPDYEPD